MLSVDAKGKVFSLYDATSRKLKELFAWPGSNTTVYALCTADDLGSRLPDGRVALESVGVVNESVLWLKVTNPSAA